MDLYLYQCDMCNPDPDHPPCRIIDQYMEDDECQELPCFSNGFEGIRDWRMIGRVEYNIIPQPNEMDLNR